nr:hypothetical protein BaRGS_023510 [Batillaria attramentaria]
MTETHGMATRLMYQLYIALNNKKKANLTGVAMETQRPAAPAKLNAVESGLLLCTSQSHLKNLTAKSLQEKKLLGHKREAEQTMDAIAQFENRMKMIQLPTDDGTDEIDVQYILKRDEERGDTINIFKISMNDEYIGKIRKRLQEDSAAREAHREEMMVNRLMRQSQQERRIAVQLLQARHEKEVIRNNRIMREQQGQHTKIDSTCSELARLHKEEYQEQIRQERELHAEIAAQRAEERYHRHYNLCSEVVGSIVDFASKVAEYRELTENLLPAKLMRDWTALFVNGCPLYETVPVDTGEPTPEQILEEERQMLLDEGDFMEYKSMFGEWQLPEEAPGPPRNNPVVGHIIQRLYNIVHPPTPPPPPPEFPPFPIRACVLGKAFAGKTTVVKKLAEEHRLVVLNVDELVAEAVEAHKNNELVEKEPEPEPELLPEQTPAAQGSDTAPGQPPTEGAPADGTGAGTGTEGGETAAVEPPGKLSPPEPAIPEKSSVETLKRGESRENSKPSSGQRSKKGDPSEPQPSLRNKLGSKALKFLKKGRPVDDQIVVDIVADAIKRIPEGTGWVLDSYPQNYNQAKLLEKALSGFDPNAKDTQLKQKGSKPHRSSLVPDPRPPPPPPEPTSGIDVVILFDIEDELCLKRASGRTYAVQADQQFHEEFNPPPDGSATGVCKQEKVIPVTDPSNDQEQIQHRLTSFQDSWSKLDKWFTRFGTLKKVDASDSVDAVFLEVEKVMEDTINKLQGKDVESSYPAETETAEKLEEVPETAPGAPPEAPAEAPKEEAPPGGPEEKTSRPGSKAGSRSASSKSPKRSKSGKKGSKATPEPEPEPEPEEPTGPPPPQPGDEEWEFVDLDIEKELAAVLADQWENVEKAYVSNCKHTFRQVRLERENIYRYFHQIRKDFLAYLRRPDHKQEFVTQWQKDYNMVPDDMREDEETRAELHQRVDDLRERLWNICDERKEQAEKERESVMTDGWLEDRLGILSNHYITTMQGELDRFQDTVRLLKDYYKGMDGQIPDELDVNYERLPLIELPMERPETPPAEKSGTETPVTPTSDEGLVTAKSDRSRSPRTKSPKDRSKSPKDAAKSPSKERIKSPKGEREGRKSRTPSASAKKRNRSKEKDLNVEEPTGPVDGSGLRIRIPLVPRRSGSPDLDSKAGTRTGKDTKKPGKKGEDGTDSPQLPNDPDERLVFDAYYTAITAVGNIMATEMAAKEAEEEAERQRLLEKEKEKDKARGGKGKGKGGKGGKSRSPSPKKGSKKESDSQTALTPTLSEDMTEEEKQKKQTREKMREEYYFSIKEEETAARIRIELIKSVAMAVLQDLKQKADSAFKDMNDWLGARFLKEMESIDTMSEVMRHAIEDARRIKEEVILQQDDFLIDSDYKVLKSPSPQPEPQKQEPVMPDHFTVKQLYNLYKQFSSIAPTGIMSSKSFVETLENIVSVSIGMETLPDVWMHITPGQIQEIATALATETDYVDWRRLLLALTWPIPTPTQQQLLDMLAKFRDMDQKKTGFITRQQFDRLFYFSAVPNSHEGFLRALSVSAGTHMPRLQKPLMASISERAVIPARSPDGTIPESSEDQEKEDRVVAEPCHDF